MLWCSVMAYAFPDPHIPLPHQFEIFEIKNCVELCLRFCPI